MFPKIQPDESIASYVRRTLFLNWHTTEAQVLKHVPNRYAFNNSEVRSIAAAIGWPGCYGFNRLIHNHSLMPASHVIKSLRDISYSGVEYVSEGFHFFGSVASFCPKCVKEDLETLGFAYWRRYCLPHVTVCHKHDVVLQDRCPFCGKSFLSQGHNLDVMWRKCGGRHLAEAPSVPNEDPLAFRRASVFYRICSSPLHISDEAATCVLRDKSASLVSLLQGEAAAQMLDLSKSMNGFARLLEHYRLNNSGRLMFGINRRVIDAIAVVYECYDDFLRDLRALEVNARSTDSLWATYQSGGMESAHFVEENYIYGVGNWLCPNPSPLSEKERSHDGYYRRRPKQYPCCNFPHPKGKGQKLQGITIKSVPGIPMINS